MKMNVMTKAIVDAVKNVQIIKDTNMNVKLYLKGEIASNLDEENFIKSTNMKYFNSDSNKLLDDFIEIGNVNVNGKAIIRIQLSTLATMTEGEIGEYITEQIDYLNRFKNVSALDEMENYEAIKNSLIIRPLNYINNRIELESYGVYNKIGDIALVLYAVVNDDKENGLIDTVKIPREIFGKWNMAKSVVMHRAMQNTIHNAEPRMYTNLLNISETLDCDSDFMNNEIKIDAKTVPLVTTTKRVNGAIALFYPGVKERIYEMYGSGFYVAFTSIHEAMLHKAGTIEPQNIRRHVREVNEHFGAEETLSNDVFYFDGNSFTVVK